MHREGVRLNPIDLRPTLSTEARAVLLRALSFDPADRYQNAAEFGDRVARAITASRETVRVPATHPVDRQTNQPQSPLQAQTIATPPNVVAGHLLRGRLKLVLGSVLIALIGITVAVYLIKGGSGVSPEPGRLGPEASPTPSPTRSFNYWLKVQKIRNGKHYQEAFLSSGKEIFETGYKFRLNVSSPEPGYLYLFNEAPPSQSGTSFTILYPTPVTNSGLATLGANQPVETNWNTFAGKTGTENFWIVWSVSPVPELEAAKTEAFKHPLGGLTGDNLVATRKFLMTKENEIKTKYTTNKETHQTTVRGTGDLLVRLVEFQHR